jgi:hypothetical protein
MIEQSIVHLPELVKDIERPVSIYLVHLSRGRYCRSSTSMTPTDVIGYLLGPIEDVQLPVDVPTLYRDPAIDLRFTCK